MIKIVNLGLSFVFFGSLSAFYFPSFFGLRLFEFLCLFLLLFIIKPSSKLRFKSNDYIILFYFFLFILYATFSLLISYTNGSSKIYLNQYFGIYFTLFISFIFFNKLKNRPNYLINAIKFCLYIHVTFFLIQFFSFYLFGYYIDFIKPITGEVQRNIGGIFEGLNAIRPSGLYGEPASYSLNIIIFNFIILSHERKISLLTYLSLLTVILSLSASGFIYLIFFLIYYLINSNAKSKIILVLSSFLISIILIAFFDDIFNYNYLIEKILTFNESSSYQYRIGAAFSDLSKFDTISMLFGVGLGNQEFLYSKGSTYSMVLIEQGYLLGSAFFISIFYLLKYFKVEIFTIAFIFIMFFGTHTFSQYQFWFFILSIIILSNYRNEQTKNI